MRRGGRAASAAGAALGDLARLRSEARRVEPVIDAWFDSGSMPAAQVGYPHAAGSEEAFAFPADFISEAIDQTRGWFYSLLAVNTLVFGRAPYRHVVCLGHIVDADGRKMSKSLGNVIDPWEILDTRGRRPAALVDVQPGLAVDPDPGRAWRAIDAAMRETLLTLWNTFSFFTTYAALNGFDPADPGSPPRPTARRSTAGLLSRLGRHGGEVTDALDAYDPLEAATALAAAGRRPLELVRAAQPAPLLAHRPRRARRPTRLAAQATLHETLTTLSLLLAPFCPFLADRVWRELTGGGEDGLGAPGRLARRPTADASSTRRSRPQMARPGGCPRSAGPPAARPG